MKRRDLLTLGFVGVAVLTVAAGGLALLNGSLPAAAVERQAALDAHLVTLGDAIGSLSPRARMELSQLLAVLYSAPGRLALGGLSSAWRDADVPEVAQALEAMRKLRLELRQQAYHALRNLTNAAYFAAPSSWAVLGYPGPRALG